MRKSRRAGLGLDRQRIGRDDVEIGAPLRAEIGKRLGAERAVDLDAGDAAGLPHPVGHQPHHRARACADIEATHAGSKADAVEQRLGRALPQQRLVAQTNVLGVVSGVHVTVGVPSLRRFRHRARLLFFYVFAI
jgi:hypothetical protein